MFFVGLLIVRLCFIGDILLFIDLFSCIAASLFNKLRRRRQRVVGSDRSVALE